MRDKLNKRYAKSKQRFLTDKEEITLHEEMHCPTCDSILSGCIATRALMLQKIQGIDPVALANKIYSAHLAQTLRLREMLDGRDCDLIHDAFGIWENWDRENQEYRDYWSPRYST